jgi:hypothetical protein
VQLTPDNSAPDQNPTLYEGFEIIYLWIMITHELFNGRRLFATETGKLGFGSLDIREGDLVSMLYGGKTMYVLRSHGAEGQGSFSFVSDAYVYDCMNGEVFELLDSGEVKEELFVIL